MKNLFLKNFQAFFIHLNINYSYRQYLLSAQATTVLIEFMSKNGVYLTT